LDELTGVEGQGKQILDAARSSMGTDISEFDLLNICQFAKRVVHLSEYREKLHEYLVKKMSDVAPNLSALIGEIVGARLISQAGSLTNLAKYPASTVQILGAEKALFRALKTKGNTPKYGLLFNSSFISRAGTRDKGRISRYLANKCSIASRFDAFSDFSSNIVGSKLRDQVEERLKFYETGVAPQKNIDVMKGAIDEVRQQEKTMTSKPSSKNKKRKAEEIEEAPKEEGKKKKSEKAPKKEKKSKKSEKEEEPPKKKSKKSEASAVEDTPKKKSKKSEAPVEDTPKKKSKKSEEAPVEDTPKKKKASTKEKTPKKEKSSKKEKTPKKDSKKKE
jgi:nucleolar protein 56